jgi:hypothetical protein
MPDIKTLCNGFREKRLSKNLPYRKNKFSKIDSYCDTLVEEIKKDVFLNHPNLSACLLDHHKIAAVHILSILKNPLFISDSYIIGYTFCDIMANEYCCFLVLQAILLEWRKHNNKSAIFRVNIPNRYKDCLLLLFRKYMKSRPSSLTNDIIFAYSFANIIYMIDTYFVVEAAISPSVN